MYNKDQFVSAMGTDQKDSSCHDKDCAAVIKSETLTNALNYPWKGGDIKVPKVLAEFVIQIDTEAKIKLSDPAFEIKRIEKQVFLTQCRFIPPTDKVFLEGYIRKNIEYASKTCAKGGSIGGVIKDTTVHIPFKAFTKVDFKGSKPKIKPNPQDTVTRYLSDKKDIMGKNTKEADRSSVEIFNEPVYCELEWSAVYDATINEKCTGIDGMKYEEEFQEFTDKSVVYLCLKLLQKQQVCLPHYKEDYRHDEDTIKSDYYFPLEDYINGKY